MKNQKIIYAIFETLCLLLNRNKQPLLEEIISDVEEQTKKKLEYDFLFECLQKDRDICFQEKKGSLSCYFKLGVPRQSSRDAKFRAEKCMRRMSFAPTTKKINEPEKPKIDPLVEMQIANAAAVREEEEALIAEIKRLEKVDAQVNTSLVPQKFQLRFRARENIKLRKQKLEEKQKGDEKNVGTLELMCMKILVSDPKKKIMEINELQAALKNNGYANRLCPSLGKIMIVLTDLDRKLPKMFRIKLLQGNTFIRLRGSRKILYDTIREKKYP